MTVADSLPAADPITAADLLREGIQIADGGNRQKARFLVRQAVGYDPANVPAWMWLAELVDSTEERIDCLRQVLARNPRIGPAVSALVTALVTHGASLIEQKKPADARQAFQQALQIDPANVPALLWAAETAPTPDEAISLYGRVLTLDPANEIARAGLAARFRPPVTERCPICQAGCPRVERTCPACRSVLVLDDPAAFTVSTGCDEAVVAAQLPRLEKAAEKDTAALLTLGLAYLNLGRSSLATRTLKAAVFRPGTDPKVREQVYRIVEQQVSGKSSVRVRTPATKEPVPAVPPDLTEADTVLMNADTEPIAPATAKSAPDGCKSTTPAAPPPDRAAPPASTAPAAPALDPRPLPSRPRP
jgi:tetratricopeptide (TPR) repeat protein